MRKLGAALVALILTTTAAPGHAIVNGAQITDASWKFLVAVGCSGASATDDCKDRRYGSDGLGMFTPQFCGGVLIGPRLVATAAHCMVRSNGSFFTPEDIYVGGGSPVLGAMTRDEDVAGVDEIVINPTYDKVRQTGDLALLVLKHEIANSSTISVLPAKAVVPETSTFQIAGWGDIDNAGTAPMAANSAEILLYPQTQCAATLGVVFDAATMLCGGAKNDNGWIDACQGDSGGPLIARFNNERTLIGLTSWGTSCAKGNPGIYARVAELLPALLAKVRTDYPVEGEKAPSTPVLRAKTRITRFGVATITFALQTDGQAVNQRTVTCTRTGQKLVITTTGLSATLRSLRYGKTYSCKAQAMNAQGKSPWSKPFTLR